MRIVSEENYNQLRDIVFSNSELEMRLRAQVVVLYEKEFKIGSIANVVEKSIDEVYDLLQFVDFFGIKEYLQLEYNDLRQRVNDENFEREKRIARLQKRGFFYYLFWPITSIFWTIYHFFGILSAILAWFYSLFSGPIVRSKNSNVATFEKGASNNYLIQINKLVVNDSEEETEEIERIVTNSQWQLQRKIEEIIASEEEITFNDNTVDRLIEEGRSKRNKGQLDRSHIHFCAGLIVAYLIYSSSFKGGVWTVSVLGVVIAISIKSCDPSPDEDLLPLPIISGDTTSIISPCPNLSDDYVIDSLRSRIEANEAVEIYDYRAYFRIIDDFFESDNECNALSAVGERQKRFINSYDKVDHAVQEYYLDEFDDKYYVHVVAYSDVRQAAFQMHYLNSSGIFDANILRVFNGTSILYAVVIGEYNGYQIKEICELVERWEIYCLNDEVEIGCYFNG